MRSIIRLIALDSERSALIDVSTLVLFFTLERILSCIEHALSDADLDLHTCGLPLRQDPQTGKLCLPLDAIPRFVRITKPLKGHRNARLVMSLELDVAALQIKQQYSNLMSNPEELIDELRFTMRPSSITWPHTGLRHAPRQSSVEGAPA